MTNTYKSLLKAYILLNLVYTVTSWNGTKTQVDRELEDERMQQQRKRNYDQMYDEELDQGKVRVEILATMLKYTEK